MAIVLDGTTGITSPEYSGDVFNASLIRSDTTSPPTIQNTNGTEIGTFCRAWVKFNGTTTPPTISASFNVSGVTRSATGQYVVTLTNALPDANGAVVGTARIIGVNSAIVSPYMDTSSTIQVNTNIVTGALANSNPVHLAVFR
jgi:hypothetical protein